MSYGVASSEYWFDAFLECAVASNLSVYSEYARKKTKELMIRWKKFSANHANNESMKLRGVAKW